MKWTCVQDIYTHKSLTSTRYIYNIPFGQKDAVREVSSDLEQENINQIFLPDKIFYNDITFGIPTNMARFSYHLEVNDHILLLQITTDISPNLITFQSDSLKAIIEKLHKEYNCFIDEIRGVKLKEQPMKDELEQAYTTYNSWTRKLMKIFSVLFVIAVLSVTLICASFQEKSSDKWWYLGVLTLNATVWTIFLLIDRQKILNLRKLQLKESERLNSKGYGNANNR